MLFSPFLCLSLSSFFREKAVCTVNRILPISNDYLYFLTISHFGRKGRISDQTLQVHVYCFSFTICLEAVLHILETRLSDFNIEKYLYDGS